MCIRDRQKEKRINRILDTLAAGQDLTADMAAAGFADIMDCLLYTSRCV